MTSCEHCGSSEPARVCDACFFAQTKGIKQLKAALGALTYENIELQKKLDLARNEIEFLHETLSKKVRK